MKLAMFYDTETTGLPLFSEPSEDPRQPHIVQLGASLVDLDTRVVLSSLDVIVAPNGWEIPAEVSAIHGITTELALDVGVPEHQAVDMLISMWRQAGVRIGHNEQFDARIVRIALMRHFTSVDAAEPLLADEWKAGKAECTQRIATPILKLPPTEKMKRAGFLKHKSANLGEAYLYFTGEPLEGAHSAMVDVKACATVYFAARDKTEAAVAA